MGELTTAWACGEPAAARALRGTTASAAQAPRALDSLADVCCRLALKRAFVVVRQGETP